MKKNSANIADHYNYLDLSFWCIIPALSLVSFIASCHFNKGTICIGVHVKTRAVSVISC